MDKIDLESVRFPKVFAFRKCLLFEKRSLSEKRLHCDMSRKGRGRGMVLDGRLPTHGQERGPVHVTEVGANDE